MQRLEFVLFRIVQLLLSIPSDASIRKWGSRIGRLAHRLLGGRSRKAIANARASFPERSPAECEDIVRRSWIRFVTMMLFYVRRLGEEIREVEAANRILDQHVLRDALDEGKGAILVTAHYGDWEFGVGALSQLDLPVTVVARFLDNELLEQQLNQSRARRGIEIVDRRSAARPVLTALAGNGIVVMLADQAVKPREGVCVPFLGRPAWTTTAPAKLAMRHGAPIVFAFGEPVGEEIHWRIEGPLRASDPGMSSVEALTTRINDVITERIRRRPELWFWQHDRWKGAGEASRSNDSVSSGPASSL
ncbi:MAG: lysophospholipid acyltransferase family protein [Thermoanaerobaculia bacterium]